MRTALALALLASAATLATACDGPFGCGGFSGGNDRVLARGNDAMILCENGGFVLTMGTENLEGRYGYDNTNSAIVHGTDTNTATVAFTLTEGTDGTSSAPELGAGAWTEATLDQVALDHADTECTNLQTRTWWTATP